MDVIQAPAVSQLAPAVVVGMCPLCHTVDPTVLPESLQDGGSWRCATCDQVWSAKRLEVVAAYAQYLAAH